MPRYFFNIRGVTDVQDSEGIELPNLDAAGQEAAHIAGGIFPMVEPELRRGGVFLMEVSNDSGIVLTMAVTVHIPGKLDPASMDRCSQGAT